MTNRQSGAAARQLGAAARQSGAAARQSGGAAGTARRSGVAARRLGAAVLAVAVAVGPAAPAFAAPTVREASYQLDMLGIPQTHRQHGTGQGVVVAVVDTGVEEHPDLAGQVLPGVDLREPGGDGHTDTAGHGTGMAGLIAGKGGGANHVLGVAPGARILPIRVIGTYGEQVAEGSTAANGIRAAVDRGAKVICVSLRAVDYTLQDAVNYALARDVVLVASAGNTAEGETGIVAPANLPGVIAVTGVDQQRRFWSGSTQGPQAAVAAPAPALVSTTSRSASSTGFAIGDGTSGSAALVAGVVALVRARYPNLDAANVINRVIRTADDLGPAGRDPQTGFGLVNPARAVSAEVPAVSANPLGGAAAGPAPPVASVSGSAGPPGVAFPPGDSSGPPRNRWWTLAATAAILFLIGAAAHSIVRRVRRRTGAPGAGSTP